MHIFNILLTSLLNIISAYDHNSLNNFVERINLIDNKHQTNLNHYKDIHNGILVMDNIYFLYDSNKFDLYISLYSFTKGSYRRIEVYDEHTAAFLKFIYSYKDIKETKLTHKEFKRRFFNYLHEMKYQTNKFTKEQFLVLTRKMFGLNKDYVIDDNFYIDHSLIMFTINKNMHIFIDCNLSNLDAETIISLVQFCNETNKYVRLTPYYFINNDLIYHHYLLNDAVSGQITNNGNTNGDYLYLTDYGNINKYLYEILHFVKISEKILYEYIFYGSLQYFYKNSFGIIEQDVPKQIRVYDDFDITN